MTQQQSALPTMPPVAISRPGQGGWRAGSLAVLAIDVVLLAWLAVEVYNIPRFQDIFDGMNVSLPALTQHILSVPPLACWLAVGLLLGGLIGKEFLADKRVTICINTAAGFLLLIAILTLRYAMLLPLLSLMRSIQAP